MCQAWHVDYPPAGLGVLKLDDERLGIPKWLGLLDHGERIAGSAPAGEEQPARNHGRSGWPQRASLGRRDGPGDGQHPGRAFAGE